MRSSKNTLILWKTNSTARTTALIQSTTTLYIASTKKCQTSSAACTNHSSTVCRILMNQFQTSSQNSTKADSSLAHKVGSAEAPGTLKWAPKRTTAASPS